MSHPDALVLVVDDETPIRRLLRVSLENAGYRVREAATGEEATRTAASEPPDLILLDLGLPDADGGDVLRRLREWYTGPIIILSARDRESQKVAALDAGADDYVTKPFGLDELLARLRVALRHSHNPQSQSTTITIGDLRFDLGARRVFRRETEIHFTPIEYKLLMTMVKHAGKVLTHRFLLREVWGPQQSEEHHYLRVFVAGLRRKLEDNSARPRYILTEQGVGYRFAAE
ncbi:MAG: response regulator [Pirellulales bacterium]